MDPIITSSLIGAGSQLLGGLFGKSSADKARQQQNRLYNKQMSQAQGQFDAQMDQSVTRRVQDAKNAGIHPLFALGASVGASPTISGGQPPSQQTGNAMGDAVGNIGRIIGAIPTQQSQVKRDEAEAAYLNAEAARVTQDLASQGRDSLGNPSGAGVRTFALPDSEPIGEPVYYRPEIPKHGENPGIVAGKIPGTITAMMPDGREVNLISPDLNMDEISQVDYVWQRSGHKLEDLKNAIKKVTGKRRVYELNQWNMKYLKPKERTYSPYWNNQLYRGYKYLRSKF